MYIGLWAISTFLSLLYRFVLVHVLLYYRTCINLSACSFIGAVMGKLSLVILSDSLFNVLPLQLSKCIFADRYFLSLFLLHSSTFYLCSSLSAFSLTGYEPKLITDFGLSSIPRPKYLR